MFQIRSFVVIVCFAVMVTFASWAEYERAVKRLSERSSLPAQREGREHVLSAFVFHGGPAGVRTLDLGIKSPLLCQLSYRSVTAKKDYTRNRRALQQENGVGNGTRTHDLQSHNLAR